MPPRGAGAAVRTVQGPSSTLAGPLPTPDCDTREGEGHTRIGTRVVWRGVKSSPHSSVLWYRRSGATAQLRPRLVAGCTVQP
mgnify:CR=1 FL=1